MVAHASPTRHHQLRFLTGKRRIVALGSLQAFRNKTNQANNKSYVHSSCGTSLYRMLVGCLLLAGKTFRIYKSPTLIVSYLGISPSSTQQDSTARSTSGSGVRKNGNEYRSRPVLFLTRCTVAWNLPFDCRSRYSPTLQIKVPGLGGASTQMPSWLRTSRAGTESWRTSVSPKDCKLLIFLHI
jgi:hypothetical protein